MAFLASVVGPWLLGKVKSYGLYVLLAIAVIGVILAVLGKAKSLGRAEERVKGLERTIDAVKRRKEIEREAAEESRSSGRSAADELRDEWSRD